MNRRAYLKAALVAGFGAGLSRGGGRAPDSAVLEIDPKPQFELSPYLYMQFMEPLGTTDSSVEAAWDFDRQTWREDVVSVTKSLAPTMLRWGGIFTDYYRWREGVGPRRQRVPMRNLLWGGMESNQVGTAEFVDFCRGVGAEPLLCVNFESDGRQRYREADGSVRTADATEAANWVAYCNQPDHPLRRSHGAAQPYNVRFWQIGNETSYNPNGFDLETARRKTVEFAKAMRRADPSIHLIGWGGEDWSRRREGKEAVNWAKGMIEAAGEHLQYVAFHHMFNPDSKDAPVLAFGAFRKDPARAWDHLMNAWKIHDAKIRRMRENAAGLGKPLAMTECHYSIPGRNRGEVLSTWAAGVSYARLLNVNERHGDILKIATAADFCGTRWQVNAVMIPVPQGGTNAFLMPVAHVMRLYRHHSGTHALDVRRAPGDLDVTASRTADRVYLHVVNTNRTRSVTADIAISGHTTGAGKAFEIVVDPELEIYHNNPDALNPRERSLDASGSWTFPAASVSAVDFQIES